jgi:hypothetical protein
VQLKRGVEFPRRPVPVFLVIVAESAVEANQYRIVDLRQAPQERVVPSQVQVGID